MSIQAVAWALDQDIREPMQKLILISLANHASHTTGECYPGLAMIAKEASCDRRTVIRHLPQLEAAGFISVQRSVAGKLRQRNTYRLIIGGSDRESPRSDRESLPPSDTESPRSDTQTLPPSDRESLRGDSSVTRGSDTAVTTNNLHSTITKNARARPAAKRKEPGRVGAEVLQASIAKRLGYGDAATGWLLFGALSEADRDQLTAQQRLEKLGDHAIDAARSKALGLVSDEVGA